ncbi:hypothetical protein [Paracoccus beibuensis]|uniref:hypothetical protein n=1 Tax=Paracoccus beibuensis TaxID=547602 RepID=UPI00223F7E48|nr:hypothetical protein [Paracoccus beibuensis]
MGKPFSSEDSFLVRDPLGQLGVVQEVEPGVRPVDLLPTGYYADNMVRCCFCAQRQTHRRGYFAVLPDGSLALCGNCCAIKIAGKETVAAIDRRRERAASGLKRKEIAERVTGGLVELMQELEDGPLQAEAAIRQALGMLRDVFDYSGHIPDATISLGAGGIKSILRAAAIDNLSEKDVPGLMQKRAKAIPIIKAGVEMLPERRRLISFDAVWEILKTANAKKGWGVEWDGRVIEYRKTELDFVPYSLCIEPIHIDLRQVKAVLASM